MRRGVFLLVWLLLAGAADAHVDEVRIERREPVLGGKEFGEYGAYEVVQGTLRYSFDPESPYNARIADLGLAPRNAEGRVVAEGSFVVLQPADPAKRRGTALLEVCNRGGRAAVRYFNRNAAGDDPWGDELLMRQGLTVVWIGWQWDVPPDRPDALRLDVPVARQPDGGAIRGLARSDWVVEEATEQLPLAHRSHRAYPVADPADDRNVLTVRDGREAERWEVERGAWEFTADGTAVRMEAGFVAGKIYELVYVAQDPRVVGLGLAAVRDAASYARYGEDCPFAADRVIALGISQTGRFLRHFLYQGFNTDEQGRPAFDGMLVLTAGAGRGSFNHRFAQPSRDAHRFSAFFYPTDLFPFAGRTLEDPRTGRADGLFAHAFDPDHLPRVFFVNTGYEYWGRAASLLHTTPDGAEDVEPGPRERIYHIPGAQHFQGRLIPGPSDRMPGAGLPQYRGCPLEFKTVYRALLVRMLAWVETDEAPPASRIPRIRWGQLLPPERYRLWGIPGLRTPEKAHVAYRADYGPRWEAGVITKQPPELGPAFVTLVPISSTGRTWLWQHSPGLFLPWNLRVGRAGPQDELSDFLGTFVPWPRSREEAEAWGVPAELSLDHCFPGPRTNSYSRERAEREFRRDAAELVAQGFLLPEDLDYAVERRLALLDWVVAGE